MKATVRIEMGIMAGVIASVVMTLAIIALTAVSSASDGFFPIQWFSWVGAVFGTSGIPYQVAEAGVAWFVALGIVAGLVYAFAFRIHTVYGGLGMGLIAWFIVALYLTFETAPQLSGSLGSLGIAASIELLLPLAVCFGLWGLAMGYVGAKYLPQGAG
ncbi:MAG: hypothetical protein ABSF83_10815 [Nitrososphaerales archaeon]|jgi:hypothetical protein